MLNSAFPYTDLLEISLNCEEWTFNFLLCVSYCLTSKEVVPYKKKFQPGNLQSLFHSEHLCKEFFSLCWGRVWSYLGSPFISKLLISPTDVLADFLFWMHLKIFYYLFYAFGNLLFKIIFWLDLLNLTFQRWYSCLFFWLGNNFHFQKNFY